MKKGNIRSIRFSDELIEIIDQQIGDNFTQKFERLVYNCYMLLPEKERQLEQLEERIQRKRADLAELSQHYDISARTLRSIENELFAIKRTLSNLIT
nr:MAG TPA: Toxin protein parE-1, Antitoxin protein, antitoxin, complex, Caulobacter, TA.6A [Inoviridae sp.]